MAKDCCGASTCGCLIQGGDGITVAGSGAPNDPYIVTSDYPDFSSILTVQDTSSVNLSLTGSGTPSDPFRLQATSSLKLVDLTDISDPEGGPAVGDSPVWVGSGPDGHFEFKAAPPSPAGSVNVSNGIGGLGSAPDPIRLLTSGTWGTAPVTGADSTTGLPIYVDTAGQVRAFLGSSLDWANIANKPATFPPSAHQHPASDITNQIALNVGIVRDHPVYFQKTEDVTWPNGTVWGSWS